MTLPKMKPCPDCGNIYVDLYSYENGWQHVECDECYYLGPGEGSKLQAIRLHNAASVDGRRMAETENTDSVPQGTTSAVANGETPTPSAAQPGDA